MRLRVFIAITSEDRSSRDEVIARSKSERLPFDFVDMLDRKLIDEDWRTACRTYIHGSDGVIALISRHTQNDPEQVWQIRCAYAEKKPVLLMHVAEENAELPEELATKHVNAWNWANLTTFMESLWREASRPHQPPK